MDSTIPPPPPAETPAPAAQAPFPWEQPGLPFFEGIIETLKLVITNPIEAFDRMPTTGGLGRPLVFVIVLGWAATIVGQIYSLLFSSIQMPFMQSAEELGIFMGASVGMAVAIMILAPVIIVIVLFIQAAILHLMLLILGAAGSGFEATTRVCCYAATAQIAQVVPICGGLIAALWGAVLLVIGFARAHRTTYVKAAVAVVLPVVICCVLGVILAVLMGGVIAGLASQG